MGMQAKLMIWLFSLVAVFAVLFGAYRYGRHVEGLERDAQVLAAVVKAVAHANELAALDKDAALIAARKDADRRIAAAGQSGRVERSIASHPEYLVCTLDDADLAELNTAVEGIP